MKVLENIRTLFTSATTRLALSYLAIIMIMSVGFSVVFYNTSSRELGRPVPPHSAQRPLDSSGAGRTRFEDDPLFRVFLEQRAEESRQALMERLVLLNILALLVGAALSYYLARRTLAPIEANMEAQAQFVGDASHELRTPLTALQTSNEVALRRKRISDAEARTIITENIADVIRLRALTDGLLRLAQRDGDDIRLVPVPIAAAVQAATVAVAPAAELKQVDIRGTDSTAAALADQQLLEQILVILLDNAVKYSPPKSTVTITASTRGKHAMIAVRDQGIGIAASDLPHVFDRFYRADSARTRAGSDGHGLGLAIARKLATQLGGHMSATSQPGKGSEFVLRLTAASKADSPSV